MVLKPVLLNHLNSQIIASVWFLIISGQEEEAQRYFDEWGGVYCDILAFEMQDRRRVILGEQSLLLSFPFAAEVPSRSGLCPRGTRRIPGQTSNEEKSDLARSS